MYRVILNSCQNASLVEDQNHHVEILYKIATFIEFLFTRGKLFQVFEIMKTSPEYKGKLNHFKFFDGYNTHNAIDEVLNSNKIYRVRADNINVNEVRMISEEGLITDLFIGMHTNVDVMNNDVIVLEDLCFHDVNNPHIGNSATNKSYLMFPDFVGYLYKTIPFDVLSENIYFFELQHIKTKTKHSIDQQVYQQDQSHGYLDSRPNHLYVTLTFKTQRRESKMHSNTLERIILKFTSLMISIILILTI